MTTNDKIKLYFKEQNIMQSYRNPDYALEGLLIGHAEFLNHGNDISTRCEEAAKHTYDITYKSQIQSNYISINELRNMTIAEIVDFLK